MLLKNVLLAGVCLGVAATGPAAHAQTCTSSQDAAVHCFVANAVKTSLTKPRYGMTLAQFESYGVAVSHILKTNHTYLVLVGTASAIADAMPPTNADGTPNLAAQDLAVTQIVSAEVSKGLANTSSAAGLQDLQWFTLDAVEAMNANDGFMQLITPGVSLRILDSYVVSATSNGTVNWTLVNSSISAAVDQMTTAGLIKLPPGVTPARVKAFAEALAQAIYGYKVATNRAHL
jgi:hypothetical protein